jgi:hypothetical protein
MYSTIKGSTKVILNVDGLMTDIRFIGLDEESLRKVIEVLTYQTLLFYGTHAAPPHLREEDWLPEAKKEIESNIKKQIFNQSIIKWEVNL